MNRRHLVRSASWIGVAILAFGPRSLLLAAAQPVTPQPGAVPLIQDEPHTLGLPLHFWNMTDPFHDRAEGPLPPRTGLDSLRTSGSAQFSAAQLRAVVENARPPLIVVDLRREAHGFADGISVSWYALHDQANVYRAYVYRAYVYRAYVEAQQHEQQQLAALRGAGEVTALVPDTKPASGTIGEAHEVRLSTGIMITERALARALCPGYFRVTATDFIPPASVEVDRFVAFAPGLPPEASLHFHCHGGEGRTTTLLAIWAMLHHAEMLTAGEIVRRQMLRSAWSSAHP